MDEYDEAVLAPDTVAGIVDAENQAAARVLVIFLTEVTLVARARGGASMFPRTGACAGLSIP